MDCDIAVNTGWTAVHLWCKVLFRLSFCSAWIMVTQSLLAFHPISPNECSRCWILLIGLCFPHRGTTVSCHSLRTSSLSWFFWYTDAYITQLRRTLLSISIWRGSSASPLCIDFIADTDAPVFQPSAIELSCSCCLTVEHSAAKHHVGIVSIFFKETFENPSLQSFFPRLSCSVCSVT